jgi:hypothetical protein
MSPSKDENSPMKVQENLEVKENEVQNEVMQQAE